MPIDASYGSMNDEELIHQLVLTIPRPGEGRAKLALLDALRARMGRNLRSFQVASHTWVLKCLGTAHAHDIPIRVHRFLEEALELVQSLGATRQEAHQLVDYVFNRPMGEPRQELGGVLTTLATLAAAAGLDMQEDGERELARVNQPEVIEKVRRKNAAKPAFSALPQAAERPLAYADDETLQAECAARGIYANDDHDIDLHIGDAA